MTLAFLAPDVVEAVLAGTRPVVLAAETLTKRTDPPLCRAGQKAPPGYD